MHFVLLAGIEPYCLDLHNVFSFLYNICIQIFLIWNLQKKCQCFCQCNNPKPQATVVQWNYGLEHVGVIEDHWRVKNNDIKLSDCWNPGDSLSSVRCACVRVFRFAHWCFNRKGIILTVCCVFGLLHEFSAGVCHSHCTDSSVNYLPEPLYCKSQ